MARRKQAPFWICTALLICFVAGMMTLWMRPTAPADPVYAGRPLSEWLDDRIETANGQRILTPKTIAMMQETGEAAIPTLLAWVKLSDYALAENLRYRLQIPVPLNQAWRTRAFYGFRALGDKIDSAIPELVDLSMNNPHEGVRLAAINSLTTRRPLTAELLIEGLMDPSPERRKRAAKVIGYLRPPEAIEPLTKALTDPDHDVRLESLQALHFYTDPLLPHGTLSAIEVCEVDPAADVRDAARQALDYQKTLRGPEGPPVDVGQAHRK